MSRKLSFELVFIAGLTPLLTTSQTMLNAGYSLAFASCLIVTSAMIIQLVKIFIPYAQRWFFIVLVSAFVTALYLRIFQLVSLDALQTLHNFLPLYMIVPVTALLPSEMALDRELPDLFSALFKLILLYAMCLLPYAGLRELLGTGSLLSDSYKLTGLDLTLKVLPDGIALFSSTAGALILAGVYLMVIRICQRRLAINAV